MTRFDKKSPMINKREEIPKLAKELVFLSDDRRQFLLNNYTNFSEEKVLKIYNFLVSAIAEQNKIVEEEIKKNPNLVYENKNKILKNLLAEIHEKEEAYNEQELKELEKLEMELNNL